MCTWFRVKQMRALKTAAYKYVLYLHYNKHRERAKEEKNEIVVLLLVVYTRSRTYI